MTQTFCKFHWTATVVAMVAVGMSAFSPSISQVHIAPFSSRIAAAREDLSPSASAKPKGYSVRWVPNLPEARTATVRVSGLSLATLKALRSPRWTLEHWKRVLAVYAETGGSSSTSDHPPMLGRYSIQKGLLSFEPQFPLEPGVAYRAEFRPDHLPGTQSSKGAPIVAVFKLPAMSDGPRTVVKQIFPSSPTLPENLLKFYVHFSAPMSRGQIYEHIRLRDDLGKEIELPFLEIDEELWDPAMTRLTLFIDPGRIKRGVLPLEEIGPALEAGKSYSLIIKSDWKDGTGKPLQAAFEKRFQVVAPDRDPPDPGRWQIQTPRAGTLEPLQVAFSEPMDQALAQRVIRVVADLGKEVAGDVTLQDQEQRWVFVPNNAWRSGTYQVLVPTTVEDLAGNNIGKPFEVDLFEGVQRRLATPTVKLPFEVR